MPRISKELLHQIDLTLRPFAKVSENMRKDNRRRITSGDLLLLGDFERAERTLQRLNGIEIKMDE
jgi:hypothetical protein